MFVLAALLFGVFIYVENRVADEAIIPPALFMNSSVPALLIIAVCIGATFFSGVYYVSLFFQVCFGDTATQAGLQSIPLVLGVVLLSIISGQVVSRTGKYRMFLYAGGLIVAVGVLLTSFLTSTDGQAKQILFLLIFGIGNGCVVQIRVLALQAA
ncbi:hypothetical protein HDU76_013181, partial [Blyttiomyces sp. JEL0837]